MSLHVVHRGSDFPRDERAEPRGVEHTGHAEHALSREPTDGQRQLSHSVHGVGDDDEDAPRRAFRHLPRNARNDLCVRHHQVVP